MAAPPRADWPTHLWLRGSRFYARMRVPPSLGLTKTHLQKSLETDRYAEAVKRLPVVVAELRLELEALRASSKAPQEPPSAIDADARWWRERIIKAGADPRAGIPQELEQEWDAEIERRLGPVIGTEEEPGGEVRPVHENEAEVARLMGLVFGRILPVDSELDRFIAEQGATRRYADRHRRAVRRLKEWLLHRWGTDDLRRVTRQEAGLFVDDLLAGGITTATANSLVSSLGVYWKWLGRRIGIEGNPWVGQTRRARREERLADKRPFTDGEVVRLLSGKTSRTLHDLMRVAALSGMRIDEIARQTVASSDGGVFQITEGKTASSIRDVPIHPALEALVERRRAGKEPQERLFDELRAPPSRSKELSAKASERFTAYRRDLGIDERMEGQRQSNVDFHSFRRWFITKAEVAGQPPHLISAVVGHVEGRKGMTLSTYSGGPSVEQMRAVVEAVQLPTAAPSESP